MSPSAWLLVFCVLIVLVSVAGGLIPSLLRLTHQRMELIISGIAGFMLGVGLLQMLPHAADELGSVRTAVLWLLGGFLTMFFLARFSAYHHHDVPAPGVAPAHDHAGPCEHDHEPAAEPHALPRHGHRLTWSGAAAGLCLHSLLDGIALAASVHAGSTGHAPAAVAGLAVFLVIFFHRPFDALTLITLMAAGGWSRRACHVVNALFALVIPVGVLLFHLGLAGATEHQHTIIGAALAFSAGTFLCIASSDLLPELQFHQHDRIPLSAALLLGLVLALGLSYLDTHDHASAPASGYAHDHDDHPPTSQPAR